MNMLFILYTSALEKYGPFSISTCVNNTTISFRELNSNHKLSVQVPEVWVWLKYSDQPQFWVSDINKTKATA